MSSPTLTAPPTTLPSLRKPTVADVGEIMALLEADIRSERLLPRTHRAVAERLRDYTVAELGGVVVAVGSMSVVDLHLVEIGVLKTDHPETEQRLMAALLAEAQQLGVERAFVLTDDPDRFAALGFDRTTLAELPEKRDRQCLRCPRLPRCRQVALHRPLEPMVLRASA